MANEYQLSYTASEIDERLGLIGDAVLCKEQMLTDEQKAQARENIDAVCDVSKVTNTITITSMDIVDNYYAMADGSYGSSTLYASTKSIPIDFDEESTITARCAILANASLTIHDINDAVLLFINGSNASEYGVTPKKYLQDVSVTLPTGAAYIRLSVVKQTTGETNMYTNPDDLYIRGVKSVNIVEVLNRVNNNVDYIIASDILYGKKIACVGDSITQSSNPDGGHFYNYAEVVAMRHNMTVYKDGIGGSTMANSGTERNPFCVDRYLAIPEDFDILTIWFGWNDAAYSTVGTIEDTVDTTFYGAYKKVLDHLITTYPTKKIGLIVPYGGGNCLPFMEAVRELSEMYGVPCLDLADGNQCSFLWGSAVNDSSQSAANLARRAALTYDGTHPNQEGHEFLSTMYEAFIKRL